MAVTTTVEEKDTRVKTEVSEVAFPSLKEYKETLKAKIEADLFRFRTCCADPRASQ
jgi:hypothetical protein